MKKLTEVELKELQILREELFNIISRVGELHLTRALLQKDLDSLNNQLSEQENVFVTFQEKERVIYKRFQEKYGPGNINMETGEITE